jgi:hypothetical protein
MINPIYSPVNVLSTQEISFCTIYRDFQNGKGMLELLHQWAGFLLASVNGSLDNLDPGKLIK